MAISDQFDNAKRQVKEWETELYQLGGNSQREIEKAGQEIREKYDARQKELKQKIEQAAERMKEII